MTDPHRKDSLGCYGNDFCRTPHLDRLAAYGVLFTKAYIINPVYPSS
jgi:arylsulfatase A-like enzyme